MAQVNRVSAGGKAGATDLTGTSYVAPVSPITFDNDGATLLLVRVGATPTNVTPQQQPCSHGRSANAAIALLANKDYALGPYPRDEFNDGNGQCSVVLSSVATVTVCVIKQP
jgi:hypothetical protein